MNEPFLILHKVRGEPAFDIAEKIGEDSDGDIWIIPTSGHRAYPAWACALDNIHLGWSREGVRMPAVSEIQPQVDWPNYRDHYACNDRPLREDTYTVQRKAASLLESLGLVKKVVVERRD